MHRTEILIEKIAKLLDVLRTGKLIEKIAKIIRDVAH